MVSVSRALSVFIFVWGTSVSATADTGVVKMSNSGLCHPPQSNWYERTKNYRAFDSLATCLDSGGELPAGMSRSSLEGAPQPSGEQRDYKRSAFGHGWDDADGDCQDSRAEALIATSSTTVRFATDKQCRVVTGRWISPFTGNVIQNSSEIDIDHVVPLKWAWKRGAKGWSQAKRESFANDMVNLWPVELAFSKDQYRIGKALLLLSDRQIIRRPFKCRWQCDSLRREASRLSV